MVLIGTDLSITYQLLRVSGVGCIPARRKSIQTSKTGNHHFETLKDWEKEDILLLWGRKGSQGEAGRGEGLTFIPRVLGSGRGVKAAGLGCLYTEQVPY